MNDFNVGEIIQVRYQDDSIFVRVISKVIGHSGHSIGFGLTSKGIGLTFEDIDVLGYQANAA